MDRISYYQNKESALQKLVNDVSKILNKTKISPPYAETSKKPDVYVAGYENLIAKLWKNGVSQILADGRYSPCPNIYDVNLEAHSVYVSGDDVYVAGSEYSKLKAAIAILWKNGEPQNLTDGELPAKAMSVYVSGDDVYVAGTKLWKNGIVQTLPDGTDHPGGLSVYVSGKDVYVAGFGGGRAILWKNGVVQNLTDGTRRAMAYSVFVVE